MPPKGQQQLPKPQQVRQRLKIHALQRMQEIGEEVMFAFFNVFRCHAVALQSTGVSSALDAGGGPVYCNQGTVLCDGANVLATKAEAV